MKHIGNLLLTVSLIVGMISAATSYLGYVGPADGFLEDGEPARLKAAAGAIAPTAEKLAELRAAYEAGELTAEAYTSQRKASTPVLDAAEDEGGTRLDAARLAQLEGADIETVFTKSFSFGRWRYWWVFLLSAIGLFAGSMLVRRGAKLEIAAAAGASGGGEATAGSPDAALAGLAEAVRSLRADLDGLPDDRARLNAILERLSEAQRAHIDTFVGARPLLVARNGLGGYAELMDRFAAAERQLNRAWCAAADGVLEEATDCLATAEELLGEAQTKL